MCYSSDGNAKYCGYRNYTLCYDSDGNTLTCPHDQINMILVEDIKSAIECNKRAIRKLRKEKREMRKKIKLITK